jgi:hypothetical protein
MTTTAASLLNVMRIRLSMCDSGTIAPPSVVVEATRALVDELGILDPEEEVEIAYSENPFHAQYIRRKTGKILAEFTVDVSGNT